MLERMDNPAAMLRFVLCLVFLLVVLGSSLLLVYRVIVYFI